MKLLSVLLLGLWGPSASVSPEEHDGTCAPGAGSTCASSAEAREAEAAEEAEEAASLLATRHSSDARSLLSARKSGAEGRTGTAGIKKACAKISGLYSCPSVSSYTCVSPFAPPNSSTNVAATAAFDVCILGEAALIATEAWMAVPLAAVDLFVNPAGQNGQNISIFYEQTQLYVSQSVGQAALSFLYDGIVGMASFAQTVVNSHGLWVNATSESEKHSAENMYKIQILSLLETLQTNQMIYTCPTPWNGDGSNGYGIFLSYYITLYVATLMQYITSFPGEQSVQQQMILSDVVLDAIPFALKMVEEYLTLRMSYITEGYQEAKDCFWPHTYKNRIKNNLEAMYTITDANEVWSNAGQDTETCTWSATFSTSVLPCDNCPSGTFYASRTAMLQCYEQYVRAVLPPLAKNWDSWLLEPARQWLNLTLAVCEAYDAGNETGSADAQQFSSNCAKLAQLNATVPASPDATVQQWIERTVPGGATSCCASFGTPINSPVCCGQSGNVASTANICPPEFPTCNQYQADNVWGYCSRDWQPNTSTCPNLGQFSGSDSNS